MTTATVKLSKFRWTQIVIAIFGTLALWFEWAGYTKTGLGFCLLAQPVWLVFSVRHRAWGVLYMTCVFTAYFTTRLVKLF